MSVAITNDDLLSIKPPSPPPTKTLTMRIKKTKFKTDQGAEFKPNSTSPINEVGSKIATSLVDVSPEFPI
jgi:hypothetical protein